VEHSRESPALRWLVHSIIKTVHIPKSRRARLFRCFLWSREEKKLAHLAWRIEESQIAGLTPVSGFIFRDEERGSRVSAAVSRNLSRNSWDLRDLTERPC
jgi:hypothetical protein